MPKDDTIEVEGIVTEVLPGTKFRVKLTNGHVITAYLAGKMRVHYVKVCEGDSVKVAMSTYDLNQAETLVPLAAVRAENQHHLARGDEGLMVAAFGQCVLEGLIGDVDNGV